MLDYCGPGELKPVTAIRLLKTSVPCVCKQLHRVGIALMESASEISAPLGTYYIANLVTIQTIQYVHIGTVHCGCIE